VSAPIADYMTPNSGTMYGYAGGGVIMQNRREFLKIEDSLTCDEAVYLMYAINPASRLTAIEYYYYHKDLFLDREKIEEWIDINFAEIPKVKTMWGCSEVILGHFTNDAKPHKTAKNLGVAGG